MYMQYVTWNVNATWNTKKVRATFHIAFRFPYCICIFVAYTFLYSINACISCCMTYTFHVPYCIYISYNILHMHLIFHILYSMSYSIYIPTCCFQQLWVRAAFFWDDRALSRSAAAVSTWSPPAYCACVCIYTSHILCDKLYIRALQQRVLDPPLHIMCVYVCV